MRLEDSVVVLGGSAPQIVSPRGRSTQRRHRRRQRRQRRRLHSGAFCSAQGVTIGRSCSGSPRVAGLTYAHIITYIETTVASDRNSLRMWCMGMSRTCPFASPRGDVRHLTVDAYRQESTVAQCLLGRLPQVSQVSDSPARGQGGVAILPKLNWLLTLL